AVIVEYFDAVPASRRREAALDATEGGQTLADVAGRYLHLMRDRYRGRRVGDVVPTRHRQPQVLDGLALPALAVANDDIEHRDRPVHAMIGKAHIGLRIGAVGDDTAVLDAADKRLHLGMVDAHDAEAV